MEFSFKKMIEKGFASIFTANLLNKFIQFGTLLVMTRVLGKSAYGQFSYAQNQLNMILLFEGLGAVTGILQYCSIHKDQQDKAMFFKYGLRFGVITNALLAVVVLVYTTFFQLSIEGSAEILRSLFLIPLFTIFFNSIQSYLRTTFRNKEFARISTLNSILYFFSNLILGYFYGVKGIVLGLYITYIICILVGLFYIKDEISIIYNSNLPIKNEKIEFIKYSLITSLTNAISQVLYLIDTFLVGSIQKNEVMVASYKVSTLIPFNLTFIPISIMVFFYPYIAQNRDDIVWVKNIVKKLTKYLLIINGVITVICILGAKLIIIILFGKEYIDAVVPFRILMIGYFVGSTFRIPYGNILASLGRVKANFYNSVISGIMNIVLDIYLIKLYGMNGAAIATVAIFIISSILSTLFIKNYMDKESARHVTSDKL